MPTPKHSAVTKTIIWYLNGTNSQTTSIQVSVTPGTLTNLPNPQQSNGWYDDRNRVQFNISSPNKQISLILSKSKPAFLLST